MNLEPATLITVPEHTAHPHRDWPFRRSPLSRYGVALVVVAFAFSMRYMIYNDLNSRLAFTFFVPAAMVAAWYGGLGPGMLATISGLFMGAYFFLPLQAAGWSITPREAIAIGLYAATTMLCVALCETLHNEIRRYEHALDHERHRELMVGKAADVLEHFGSPSHPGWPYERPGTARYGAAFGVVVIAFALRYWLFAPDDHRLPFLFFVPAAMIATWYGGMAVGLLATAAGLLLGDAFFLSQHEAMGAVRESERLGIGLYAVTTTVCVMLFENLHNRIRRLEHALEHARHNRHKVHSDSGYPSAASS